jgi:hypothetical protein
MLAETYILVDGILCGDQALIIDPFVCFAHSAKMASLSLYVVRQFFLS